MYRLFEVVSVANGLFEQLDGWDFNHVLGEIGTELQAKRTDDYRIPQQERLDIKNETERPLPYCVSTRSLSMPIEWWQERLALIVEGRSSHAGEVVSISWTWTMC